MNTYSPLWDTLLQTAVCHTEHPGEAVSALMRAAAEILQRSFGQDVAIELLSEIVAEATDHWRSIQPPPASVRH
ncbi:hypothetical protein PQ455_00740 [Sphingomonas naphthae]|uniref:Uncharacterized protein n=1 Tax=Sphingomonas naphthae TaxID=1813468 RepID=A0ABY7TLE2_9SPHN|nr:hypothetical protein [Sphingomonas naphthae]WCT73793.1 hypothetical protein PQ455_00740 [Sphingomonas naphthae]